MENEGNGNGNVDENGNIIIRRPEVYKIVIEGDRVYMTNVRTGAGVVDDGIQIIYT